MERSRTSLVIDDMISHVENPKESTKVLQLIIEFSKVTGPQSVYKNHLKLYTHTFAFISQFVFLYTSKEPSKNKVKKNNSLHNRNK